MADTVPGLKEICLAYEPEDSDDSAREIVFRLYPHWKTDAGEVKIQQFTDGIMNTLLKLTKVVPGQSEDMNDKQAILLRSYGRDSDVLIDREAEIRTQMLLAERQLAMPLLARFQQGLLYSFIPGEVCTEADLHEENIWRAIAARLGEWHARMPLPMSTSDQTRDIWIVMQEWLEAMPQTSNEANDRRQKLQSEFEKCRTELCTESDGGKAPLVLGHCDLLSANIIIPLEDAHAGDLARAVHFIDFEYSVPCPAAFDLANHFSEWAGYDCNYALLPSVSLRRKFIEQYLQYYNQHQPEHETKHISAEQLCIEVDRYRGMPGLYWGTFAFIQGEISTVEFDWQPWGEKKLNEFWAWREAIAIENDGGRHQAKEKSRREQMWSVE